MSVLHLIQERFKKEQPLKGATLACCLHVTSETANLMVTLKSGGAKVILCASNPLSTNDSVAASLVKDCGIPTFPIKGEDNKEEIRTRHMFLFKTEQIKLIPKDKENPEARWVKIEDVTKLLTHKKDKEFFLKHLKDLN